MIKQAALKWASPKGEHHKLLSAAINCDDKQAMLDFKSWLANHDIDDTIFSQHRLLHAITNRFGAQLSGEPSYPRLLGLHRQMWARSQLAAQHNMPSIIKLHENGIKTIFIKGAAMVSLDYVTQKSRIAHDIDLLVRPKDAQKALQILHNEGWTPANGRSNLFMHETVSTERSTNMFRDRYGDIDLHTMPFHEGQGTILDDDAFWNRCRSGKFSGKPTLIPGAEDALAIAIGHGGFDGHTHSDWLVDCAQLLRHENIDFDLLFQILETRKITPAGAVSFSYLENELGYFIPDVFLKKLINSSFKYKRQAIESLIQIKPKQDFNNFGKVTRWLAKRTRKNRMLRLNPNPKIGSRLDTKISTTNHEPTTNAFALSHQIESAKIQSDGSFHISIIIKHVPISRKFRFEINTENRHIGNFQTKTIRAPKNDLVIKVSGCIELESDEKLFIQAQPMRNLRDFSLENEVQRYGAMPFAINTFPQVQ